jgi:hypothetical protein
LLPDSQFVQDPFHRQALFLVKRRWFSELGFVTQPQSRHVLRLPFKKETLS